MEWNDTTDLLDRSADLYPEHVAITDGESEITYSELKRNALCLALNIANILGTAEQSPVAVYMDDNIACITCFFGILYSGNFFSLINPHYPKDYIQRMIDVLHPEVIVTDIAHEEIIKKLSYKAKYIVFEDTLNAKIDRREIKQLPVKRGLSDICSIVFTSGSTGKPKGVITTHAALINTVLEYQKYFGLCDDDVIALMYPFASASGFPNICLPLSCGNKLLIFSVNHKTNMSRVSAVFEKEYVTIVYAPASWMRVVADQQVLKAKGLQGIRLIAAGGEAIRRTIAAEWMNAIKDILVIHAYGLTETTGGCIFYKITGDDLQEDIPVGVPVGNMKAYILNGDGSKVETGKIGELYIGGDFLATGYYDDFEKTKERFIQNPLNNKHKEILYKTGDLAFLDENEILHYVGRRDHQIQHHGYRVELSEVEGCVIQIMENQGEAACIYNKEEDMILCFYSGDMDEMELHKKVHDALPHYMMPGTFVRLPGLPHNMNEKIDRIGLEKLWKKRKLL